MRREGRIFQEEDGLYINDIREYQDKEVRRPDGRSNEGDLQREVDSATGPRKYDSDQSCTSTGEYHESHHGCPHPSSDQN